MAKSKSKSPAKKVVAKPVAKKAAKTPAKKVAAKSAPKKAAKPAAKKAVKTPAKKVVKAPIKKAAAKPVAKKAVKTPAKKVAAKPIAKKVVKTPTKKVAAKAAPKKAVKAPVKKAPVKPIAKKAVKAPIKKIAAKPVAKKAIKTPVKKVAAKPTLQKQAVSFVNKAKESARKLIKSTEETLKKLVPSATEKKVAKPVATNKTTTKPTPLKESKKSAPVLKTIVEKVVATVEKEIPIARYSDEELKEFKEIIDKQLGNAREELVNLKDSLESQQQSHEGNKSWNMEEGADASEMEYLMSQISRQNKFIRDLEMALVRIENKTYGICRETGKLIDKNRLRIVPHATLSIEAKVNRKSNDDASPVNVKSEHMGSEGEGFIHE